MWNSSYTYPIIIGVLDTDEKRNVHTPYIDEEFVPTLLSLKVFIVIRSKPFNEKTAKVKTGFKISLGLLLDQRLTF